MCLIFQFLNLNILFNHLQCPYCFDFRRISALISIAELSVFQVLDLLGPKTAADMEKPVKKKGEKTENKNVCTKAKQCCNPLY